MKGRLSQFLNFDFDVYIYILKLKRSTENLKELVNGEKTN